MKKVFNIVTYRLKDNSIVFDYPSLFIYKEPLIKGTDTLINKIIGEKTKNSEIKFSNYPLKNNNVILHYHHSEDDGDYYVDQISNQLCFICPMIHRFFNTNKNNKLNRIYIKIK